MRITAATMHGVLRQYAANMRFTAVLPPKGLVAEAQLAKVLDNPEGVEDDVTADATFKREVKELEGLATENEQMKAAAPKRAAPTSSKDKKAKKPKKAAS